MLKMNKIKSSSGNKSKRNLNNKLILNVFNTLPEVFNIIGHVQCLAQVLFLKSFRNLNLK